MDEWDAAAFVFTGWPTRWMPMTTLRMPLRPQPGSRYNTKSWRRSQEVQRNANCPARRHLRKPPQVGLVRPGLEDSTVTSVASQMYVSRDFSAMPILADAPRRLR